MVPSAFTAVGADLTMATSARGGTALTVVTAVEVLLVGFGSMVLELTVAVLVTVPDAGAVLVIEAEKVARLARAPALQVNPPVAMAQPTVGVDGPARLNGRVSVNV